MANRVSQEVIEVVYQVNPNALVTQDVVEVADAYASNALVTQDVLEVVDAPTSNLVVTQDVLEVLDSTPSSLRATQVTLEVLRTVTGTTPQNYFVPAQRGQFMVTMMGASAPPSNYSQVIEQETGLVSYWQLNETSGTTATDSQDANNGAFTGGYTLNPAPPGTQVQGAVTLDGSTNYLSVNRNIQDDFTIEFWFKTTGSAPAGSNYYNGWGLVNAEVSGVTNDFGTSLVNGGQVAAGTGNPDTTIRSVATNLNDGNWHYVAFTRVRSTGVINLYVDSAAAVTALGNSGGLTAPAAINFGRILSGGGFFPGSLSNVAFYNVALSSAQVTAHFNAATGGSPYSGVILATMGIVSLWQLHDPYLGRGAFDSKGGNPGYFFGYNYLLDSGPGSLMSGSTLFNGSNGYIQVPNSANLSITGNITVEAWFMLNTVQSGTWNKIVEKGFSSGSSPYINYCLGTNTGNPSASSGNYVGNGNGTLEWSLALGGVLYECFSKTIPTAGQWYYVVGTYDGANLRIYVNGVLENTLAATGAITNSGQPFMIAAHNRGGSLGEYFPGELSNVAVYNVALTQTQITTHYASAGNPNARLSQEAVDTLYTDVANARLSQETAEVLYGDNANLLVTQEALEVAHIAANTNLLVTQEALEVAHIASDTNLLVTQEALEVLRSSANATNARLTALSTCVGTSTVTHMPQAAITARASIVARAAAARPGVAALAAKTSLAITGNVLHSIFLGVNRGRIINMGGVGAGRRSSLVNCGGV